MSAWGTECDSTLLNTAIQSSYRPLNVWLYDDNSSESSTRCDIDIQQLACRRQWWLIDELMHAAAAAAVAVGRVKQPVIIASRLTDWLTHEHCLFCLHTKQMSAPAPLRQRSSHVHRIVFFVVSCSIGRVKVQCRWGGVHGERSRTWIFFRSTPKIMIANPLTPS